MLAAMTLPTQASAPREFSVDTMLKHEGVGEVLFSPDGSHLLIEHQPPYGERSVFLQNAFGREAAAALGINLTTGVASKLGKGDVNYWVQSYSPAGSRAALGWWDEGVPRTALLDVASGKVRHLDLTAGVLYCFIYCAQWVSETEFVQLSPSEAGLRRTLQPFASAYDRIQEWNRQQLVGKVPTVAVYGVGAAGSEPPDVGLDSLVRVNAVTGEITRVAEGKLTLFVMSPDGRRGAIANHIGAANLGRAKVAAATGLGMNHELVITDLSGSAEPIRPCVDCDVVYQSMRWSPNGSRLFFSAKKVVQGEVVFDSYIYDVKAGAVSRFAPKGLLFTPVEDGYRFEIETAFHWLGDDEVAFGIRTAPASGTSRTRYEWFAMTLGGSPASLTRRLPANGDGLTIDDHVAVHDGALLMRVGEGIWRLQAKGAPKHLTGRIGPVRSWCSAEPNWRNANGNDCAGIGPWSTTRPMEPQALRQGWLTLRTTAGGAPTGDLVFLNVTSGATVRLDAPAPGAQLLSASALTKKAVYLHDDARGQRVLLASSTGPARELLRINEHLVGIDWARRVSLPRRDPVADSELEDCMLLPPGHSKNERAPVIVVFYPNAEGKRLCAMVNKEGVSFLNWELAAARGYAVLFASTRTSTPEQRGSTMTELHDQLLRAVENAVVHGYVDSERWAIAGHSYGGYATASVLTQTGRFKAAIALSGLYNLTSAYGVSDLYSRVFLRQYSPTGGGVWAEGTQGRMGGAPWEDPQRYIDNSPLFHAGKIQTPTMIVVGNDDPEINDQSEEMFNALARQGKDVQFVRYWGEGHGLISPANIRDLWTRMIDFLDAKLK